MTADVFIDTNILVYAYDVDAGTRHEAAKALVSEAWRGPLMPWISVQVLQELLAALRKGGVPLRQACKIVAPHTHWRVVETDVALFRSGMEDALRWQLSHWDGLILAAARRAGVKTLISEDFNTGQDYGGIRAVNPFA
jgi:predicted nucleic acid-binding protein